MNISEVVEKTGLTAKSIRLYEEKQLISLPKRAENGYRSYENKHVQELSIIASARRVGFTLDECRELVFISMNEHRMSAEVKRRTSEKLTEVKKKIAELRKIEEQLNEWLSICPGDSSSNCPIVEDLKKGCKRK